MRNLSFPKLALRTDKGENAAAFKVHTCTTPGMDIDYIDIISKDVGKHSDLIKEKEGPWT